MKRFRQWLICTFLPAWAKDSVYRENEELKAEIARLKNRLAEQGSYIEGLERGMRAQRRIVINNEVKK